MKKYLTLILSTVFAFLTASAQIQKPSTGTIDRYENFTSKFTTTRNVEVWLPEGYSAKKKYAVLYMHDGQMLFDATTTWNKKAWEIDDVAARLMKEGTVKDFIVVGIWNGGTTRHKDYFPLQPFESLTQEQRQFVSEKLKSAGRTNEQFQPASDNYLKFLVYELKPFIDEKYSTHKGRKNTFIMGSSMGGLISMYAITQYPKVFGGAACLSTHWPGIFDMDNNPVPDAFLTYLDSNLQKIKHNKIYFDYGDQTLDALYPPLQAKADSLMRNHHFSPKHWLTKFFPGKDHSESSWSERLNLPLLFLLGRK